MSLGTSWASTSFQLGELSRLSLEDYTLLRDSTVGPREIRDDSRLVEPGDCFVAIRGQAADGHRFIPRAVERGAKSLVVERLLDAPEDVGVLVVPDGRVALAALAAVHYGLRDRQRNGRLHVAGVTGTNGKSTVAFLVRDLLRSAGRQCGLLGTVEYDLIARRVPATLTTPGPLELTRALVEIADNGAAHAVIEASSHALDQHRVSGVRFDVAAFTNLTGDHVDYHATIENYLRSKKRLFDGLDDRAVAVVNADDPASKKIIADCSARVVSFSTTGDPAAQITARDIAPSARGTRFVLAAPDHQAEVATRLIGPHNVSNVLAAVGIALAMDLPFDLIVNRIPDLESVPGRLEEVTAPDAPFSVLVDYAHTDDALGNVLRSLRHVCPGRLIALFGCGGDRDRTKRPRMAAVCEQFADQVVVTSDNPRTEDPAAIIREILAGFSKSFLPRVHVEPNRRSAIERAIGLARSADTVLLAGKGHEDYQIIGTRRVWFDDRVVAGDLLAGGAAIGGKTT